MPLVDDRRQQVLDEAECRRLLATAVIGRLAYTEAALPAIAPVHFTVLDDQLLIPSRLDSSLTAATRGAVVAFQVDAYEQETLDVPDCTGWSVTVVGPSHVISDPAEVAALDAAGGLPWYAGRHCYVVVRMGICRGRRIQAPRGAGSTVDTPS